MRLPRFLRFGEDARHDKAKNRLSKLPSHAVCDWGMDSLWATQAGLERFQVHNDETGLLEARQGLVNLLAVTDVLMERQRA